MARISPSTHPRGHLRGALAAASLIGLAACGALCSESTVSQTTLAYQLDGGTPEADCSQVCVTLTAAANVAAKLQDTAASCGFQPGYEAGTWADPFDGGRALFCDDFVFPLAADAGGNCQSLCLAILPDAGVIMGGSTPPDSCSFESGSVLSCVWNNDVETCPQDVEIPGDGA